MSSITGTVPSDIIAVSRPASANPSQRISRSGRTPSPILMPPRATPSPTLSDREVSIIEAKVKGESILPHPNRSLTPIISSSGLSAPLEKIDENIQKAIKAGDKKPAIFIAWA